MLDGSTVVPVGCVTVGHEGLQWHLGSGDVLDPSIDHLVVCKTELCTY